MRCPRCENVTLEEIDRSGVTVDRCASCRGIWLDRGELEKILSRATAELDQPREQYRPREPDRSRDYDREPPSSPKHYRGHKHKSFWHELFD